MKSPAKIEAKYLELSATRPEVWAMNKPSNPASIRNAAEREQQLQAALTAYIARLEALCRAAPYNWFNFHDFWAEDAPH